MWVGIGVLVAVTIGCASPAISPTARFFAVDSAAPSATEPITDKAITVRGVQGVLAANGRFIGRVWVKGDGDRSRIESVREATRAAASAGGTHIMLNTAEVTREQTTSYVGGSAGQGNSNRSQPLTRDTIEDSEVRAVFDGFCVELEDWKQLQPSLRPLPKPTEARVSSSPR